MTKGIGESEEFSALLAQVRAGDDAALLQLLRRYEPRVRAAVRVQLGALLRPHLDSFDVVQSVYCALLPGLRRGKYDFSNSEDLIALALTLVRRKIARQWRLVRRERPLGDDVSFAGNDDPHRLADGADPATTAMVNDQVRSMLAGLDDLDRALVELRLQGYRTVEIAQKLDCNAAALRARLSRLRLRLRQSGYADWL
jgi:RNA polymerase sigma-70 factor (ECF subfamily)